MKTALTLLLVLGLGGCKKKPPEPVEPEPAPVVQTQVARPGPTRDQLTDLRKRLSVKDPEPDCAKLDAELEFDPAGGYSYVVKTAKEPPWTAMRAASCLLELYPERSRRDIVGWMKDENTEGLARLVLAKLGKLPDEIAVAAVEAGLEGTLPDATREAAAADARSAVKKLAK